MATRLCILTMMSAGLLLGGCSEPMVRYSLDTPPLVLAPASLARVEDGRGRFREIYCAVRQDHGAALPYDRPCEEVILRLDGEPNPTGQPVLLGQAMLTLRFLIVPGLLNDCIDASKAFSFARAHVERYGYRTTDVRVSGWSSSTHNAMLIRDALVAADLSPDEKVVLVGYSKGAPDILQALVEYPEIVKKVAAIVSIAGAVGGSPLADMIGEPYLELLRNVRVPVCPPGVGDPVESLKRATRQQWLSRNRLPESVKYFSLAAFAERADVSAILQPTYDRLARIDPRNDSQLIFCDQIIPGSTLLGYVKVDHWALAIPFSQDRFAPSLVDKNEFPREVLLEAIFRFVEEKLLIPD